MTMVIREYQGSVIDVTEMMHELTNLEKQYQQAKAELTDKWFQDETYSDDMFIADLKGLQSSWLIACYNKSL